jgi:hypothetical protein
MQDHWRHGFSLTAVHIRLQKTGRRVISSAACHASRSERGDYHYASPQDLQGQGIFCDCRNREAKTLLDRVLQHPPRDVMYEVNTAIGEGGRGYVLKTRYFNPEKK